MYTHTSVSFCANIEDTVEEMDFTNPITNTLKYALYNVVKKLLAGHKRDHQELRSLQFHRVYSCLWQKFAGLHSHNRV